MTPLAVSDEQIELKLCTHCGKTDTLRVVSASTELWDEENDGPYPHSESLTVVCSAARPSGPGGCGASGGYYPTEAEAIAAWNRRSVLALAGPPDALYKAVNEMMAVLGCHGTISARDDRVQAVMDALHAIDGGAPVALAGPGAQDAVTLPREAVRRAAEALAAYLAALRADLDHKDILMTRIRAADKLGHAAYTELYAALSPSTPDEAQETKHG